MTHARDDEKLKAYNFFWQLPDEEVERLFPMLDGFWSSTTREALLKLDPLFQQKKRMCAKWIWERQDWTCPVCGRRKKEIIKKGKSGKIIFDIVSHHDHASDLFSGTTSSSLQCSSVIFARRFTPITICVDCNVAEANTKGALGIEQWFTFAPREIRQFITASNNQSHQINLGIAKEIYRQSLNDVKARIQMAATLSRDDGQEEENPLPEDILAIFETLGNKVGLNKYRILWAFERRSRTHFYTSQSPSVLKDGIISPF